MAAPASYTEATLATYMHTTLGAIAGALSWTVAGNSYAEPVNEALLVYGVSDIAAATEIQKLRAIARREAWRAVVAGLAAMYNFATDGQSFSRSQMQAQALEALRIAEADAMQYDTGAYEVRVDKVERTQDPYQYYPDERRLRP